MSVVFFYYMLIIRKAVTNLGDSLTTKKGLALALKTQMQTTAFRKISIESIAKMCQLNRKSFYYHFKDKYDLLNWIFDTEFSTIVENTTISQRWDLLSLLCNYLYDNKSFYRKAFKIEGQNSFRSHITERIKELITKDMTHCGEYDKSKDFQIEFISDGFVCAIERWLLTNADLTPNDFLEKIKEVISKVAENYYNS